MVTTRTTLSCPGWTSTTLAMAHLVGSRPSSRMITTSPILMLRVLLFHFAYLYKELMYSSGSIWSDTSASASIV